MVSRKPTGVKGQAKVAGSGRKPVDPQTRKRILELAQQTDPKLARNAIARECGVSPSTVTRLVAEELPDHTWDREAVRAATEAKVVDMKAKRVALAEGLLEDVARIRGMFFEEVERKHYSVANGEVTYYSKPTPDELRNLFTAVGIGLDKHLVLVRHDSDDRDLPAVDRWLADMMGRGQTVVAA